MKTAAPVKSREREPAPPLCPATAWSDQVCTAIAGIADLERLSVLDPPEGGSPADRARALLRVYALFPHFDINATNPGASLPQVRALRGVAEAISQPLARFWALLGHALALAPVEVGWEAGLVVPWHLGDAVSHLTDIPGVAPVAAVFWDRLLPSDPLRAAIRREDGYRLMDGPAVILGPLWPGHDGAGQPVRMTGLFYTVAGARALTKAWRDPQLSREAEDQRKNEARARESEAARIRQPASQAELEALRLRCAHLEQQLASGRKEPTTP